MTHSAFIKTEMLFMLSARQPNRVEATTRVFQQPDDEIPRTSAPEAIQGKIQNVVLLKLSHGNAFAAPFSCHHEGNWYREREEFREGPDDCSICLCVNTVVKCNDESCPRSTTTTTTTTTPAPTTPFGPRGEIGNNGERGDAGERGEPVRNYSKFIEQISHKNVQGSPGTPGVPGNPG